MIVSLSNLGVDEKRYDGEEPGSILELDNEELMRVEGPVRYDLRINLVNSELIVRGDLKVDMSFLCVRCAEFFPVTVHEPSFLNVREAVDRTECVDLTGDIRESIILAFATNPVCDPGCKGLCAQCGTNLNRKKC